MARLQMRVRGGWVAPRAGLLSTSTSTTPPLVRGSRDYRIRRLLISADTAAMLAAIASWLIVDIEHPIEHALWALITIPLWLTLFLMYGLYSTGIRRVKHTTVDDIPALSHAFLVGGILTWGYFRLIPPGKVAFSELLLYCLVGFAVALTLRSTVRGVALAMLGPERVLFVGSGPITPMLVRQIAGRPLHGFQPIGVLTREENDRWPLPLIPLGNLASVDAERVIGEHRIDRVIVSAEGIDDDKLIELVNTCGRLGVKVSALPSLASMIGPAAMIDQLEGITLIGINTPSLPRSSRFFKRAMDLVGATILLILAAPVGIAVAIAIKLDSRGPVLFTQERVGRGGVRFRLAKFRSMVVDAEEQREMLLAQSRQADWLDLEDDPRITRVGRWLRHTSLDELPQLWSVIRGDMSLVGPRPLIPQEDQHVTGWARGRLDLTPGVTGMWQVLGRVNIPFDQMVMIDYLYVANWSLWTDVALLLRTLPVVLKRNGVN